MEWDKFNKSKVYVVGHVDVVETNIECPKCGKNLFMRTDMVYPTHPAQYKYECDCGWNGLSSIRWGRSYIN